MSKLVSVIIPVYNAESTIRLSIQSILNQSYKNLEIIVVDDGSTDSTVQIVEELSRLSKNIRIFQQNRNGAASARNLGIKVANGYYIQFMDSDDVLSTDKLENQIRKLEELNCDLVFCRTRVFKKDDDLLGSYLFSANDFIPVHEEVNANDLMLELYSKGDILMIQPNAFLSTKKLLRNVGFWKEELTLDDDGEYFTRVILVAGKVLFDKDSINYYRVSNSNSLSKSSGFEAFLSAKKSLLSKLSYFKMHLNSDECFLVSRNLISVFYYTYFTEYNNEKNFIEVEKMLDKFGGFNRIIWPRKITRIASRFLGNKLIFKIKLWILAPR